MLILSCPHICVVKEKVQYPIRFFVITKKKEKDHWQQRFCRGSFDGSFQAFDTLNHDLLNAKRHTYGSGKESLMLLLSYLSNRWHRSKINASFSSWTKLLQGVPQRFQNNYIKMNSDKCHLLVASHKFELISAKIGTDLIWESNSVKLLGITIDNHLKFNKYISLLCVEANRKFSAPARVSYYLTFYQKRILIKTFFECQLKHCPLTWMFQSGKRNNKINLLHERALRMIYND